MTETRLLGLSLGHVEKAAFARLVERLLWHLGFSNVSNVDGSGDGGADLVALRDNQRWVFQAKSKRTGAVKEGAVEELRRGLQLYDAHRGAMVTNGTFSANARERADQLSRATGIPFGLWGRTELLGLAADSVFQRRFNSPDLRPYQVDAYQAAKADLRQRGQAFLVLATGLGKTVIAGSLIDWFLGEHPEAQVLVLAHTRDLVEQLERALWRHLPAEIPTQQLQGAEKPEELPGITVATIQTGITYLRNGYRPAFIFIDEAHHAGESTQLSEALDLCEDALRLGATATPWRGDAFDIETNFGPPSFAMGIEEGMRLGYLANVRYRLFIDNIDWDFVAASSRQNYSVRDLNSLLFLPQLDEGIRDELLTVWYQTPSPRGIVFCRTIEHCERLVELLRRVPAWARAEAVHNGKSAQEVKRTLAKFRLGDVPLLVSVDMLNEGVDVPDVNIICFARVTHSRRIFVQQLGRGLRLSEGKSHVTVLDFISDVRRAAAMSNMRRQVTGEPEAIVLPSSHSITFTDAKAERLIEAWLQDVADLESAADESVLDFPDFLEPY